MFAQLFFIFVLTVEAMGDENPFHTLFLKEIQTDKCLTTEDDANNGRVVIWECNSVDGNGNQDWLSLSPSEQVLEYYQLKNLRSGKCLTVNMGQTEDNTPVNQYDCWDGALNQLWKMVHGDDGSMFFVEMNSGKCLTVVSTDNNGDVNIYECIWAANQKWTLLHLDHEV